MRGGTVIEDGTTTAQIEARRMLELFASVGATSFNMTWTNVQDQPRRSRKGMSFADLRAAIPRMLDAAIASQLNLIVRRKVGLRIDAIQFRGSQDQVHCSGALAAEIEAGEDKSCSRLRLTGAGRVAFRR
jgi:hypothetical protein